MKCGQAKGREEERERAAVAANDARKAAAFMHVTWPNDERKAAAFMHVTW